MVGSKGSTAWRALTYPLLALAGLLGCLVYLLMQDQLIALDPAGFATGGVRLLALFWASLFVLVVVWLLALFFGVRLWRRGSFAFDRSEGGHGIGLRLGVLTYLALLGLVTLLAWRYWQGYGAYLLAG